MTIRPILLAVALAVHLAGAAAPPLMNGPVTAAPNAAALVGQLAAQRARHGLDADHHFLLASQHPGLQGSTVVRAHHTYKGVRVFGSESVLVADGAGNIVRESVSARRVHLGRGSANQLGAATAGFDVKPALTALDAIALVLRSVRAGAVAETPPAAELIVFPLVRSERLPAALGKADSALNALDMADVVAGYELAWLVGTRLRAGPLPVYHDTIVSARNGRILAQWSMLQSAAGTGKSQYSGEVPLSTSEGGAGFRMIDPLRAKGGKFGGLAVTNANHGSSAGEVFTNSSNTWGDGKQYIAGGSTTDANGQTAAVNAMWGLASTYDMLRNALGWHSLDGQDTATYIAAHVNTAYDNAYYSDTCKCMFIGDGSTFNSLGALDVVGHEMGHGVTDATSRLVYAGESGGLNESSSDITGEVVEAYARAGAGGALIPAGGNDWMIGKDISKTGTPLRYMIRPSKDGTSPDAWSSRLRRLDVHYSSGPNNRMFYFLAQGSHADPASDAHSAYLSGTPRAMSGIGLDKAYRIWFNAATTRFTSSTDYKDARAKMLAAAEELYGKNSKEAVAVQRAYAAVNVGGDIDEQLP
ncbi:M4 family metallopeptidase [Massilia sp. CCM 9210]|uniref:M4 family metallopeptidase n=1 Tax=Massilia scottii TaxID=3057166 RepID=UPI002796B65F|nr:M4 family metallopeptidase [Massilia sp. CCM 9210]MDQ1813244.1 M4 family metallopeptidase [Massilia sp. CCM 9210]